VSRFIFVCYQHGYGGESLAVEISKLEICNPLEHEKQEKRTWTQDHFNKLFLKPYNPEWKHKVHPTVDNKKYYVVPSHYRPETLRELFPMALYVVINSPTTKEGLQSLNNRIYKNVWLTKHKRLDQKIGYFILNAGHSPDRRQLKELAKDITNGEIQCVIHRVMKNRNNIKSIFKKSRKHNTPDFLYQKEDKLITISYDDRMDKKTDSIMSWLTKNKIHI